jgi:siroheme synthase-like protein
MGYYASYLDVGGRRCVVVGGGDEAAAKAEGLLRAGAAVVVVADTINSALEQMVAGSRVEVRRRGFQDDDLDGAFLVIDASGDDASGDRVASAARDRRVLVNVLDRPQLCDFIAPALVQRGPLQVAISTGGRSPFMAAEIRRHLEQEVTEAHGELVEMVGQLRDRLRGEGVPLPTQNEVYARIPVSSLVEMLREGRHDEAAAELERLAEEVG